MATSIPRTGPNADACSHSATHTGDSAEALLARIDPQRLPRHIAIIMDGNGRWARERGKSRIEGHRAGVESVREITTACRELGGIKVLTLYAFSQENWRRPRLEVRALMRFLDEFLRKELETLTHNQIRLSTIGDISRLPPSVLETLDGVRRDTADFDAMTLVLALAYGGRQEILDAVRRIARECVDGTLQPEAITEEVFAAHLDTGNLPDPDLMIRTSGELRISNFLPWQMAYTEFVFTPTLWPDFRRANLYQAILDYQSRERRFGLTGDQMPHRATGD